MPQYKFEDCAECRFRRSKRHCRDCDSGEFFEEQEVDELDFSDHSAFSRSNKSLVTIDDEPYYNPDDFVSKFEDSDDSEDNDHED